MSRGTAGGRSAPPEGARGCCGRTVRGEQRARDQQEATVIQVVAPGCRGGTRPTARVPWRQNQDDTRFAGIPTGDMGRCALVTLSDPRLLGTSAQAPQAPAQIEGTQVTAAQGFGVIIIKGRGPVSPR